MKPKSIPLLLAALGCLTGPAYSQSPPPPAAAPPAAADPFLKSNAPPSAAASPTLPGTASSGADANAIALPREGLVRMEVFTLSLEDGRAATRRFPQQSELHAWLGAELENQKSSVKLERLMVLRVRGGQRSKLEEIAEYPYPTEFDPPQIPQTIGIGQPAPQTTSVHVTTPTPPPPAPAPTPVAPGAKGDVGPTGMMSMPIPGAAGSSPSGSSFSPWPYTTTTPQSFEFKNTGWTFEIEMTIADDGQSVDLNMAPAFIRFCGLESQSPNGEVVQPVFETSKIGTQVLTKFGQPTLVGTFSPPVDAGVAGGNKELLTRLLFVTVINPR